MAIAWPLTVNAVNRCSALFAHVSASLVLPVAANPVSAFMIEHGILTPTEVAKISQQLNNYRLVHENMNPVFILKTIEYISSRSGPRVDLIYKKFYRELFLEYVTHFETSLKNSQGSIKFSAVPHFDLKESEWNAARLAQFSANVRRVFENTQNVSLQKNNKLLTQMIYLQAALERNIRLSASELSRASAEFLALSKAGHFFLPAPSEWGMGSMSAQWFLKVSVNMAVPGPAARTPIHGGLTALESILHDQNHVYQRISSILKSVGRTGTSADVVHALKVGVHLEAAIARSLTELKKQNLSIEHRRDLRNGLFVILHESVIFEKFLVAIRSGGINWQPDLAFVQSFAAEIAATSKAKAAFYVGMSFSQNFEKSMQQLVSVLGAQTTTSELPALLRQ